MLSDTHTPGRLACALVLIVLHAVLVLELNFPGHLSIDSTAHLYEWHTKQQVSYNPVFVTWWVGVTNIIWPEGGGAMILSLAMHCLAMMVLVLAVRKLSFWVLGLLFIWSIWPVSLLYNGIVWKDVIFANAALLSASLALASRRFPRVRFLWLGVLALAPFLILARQNGAAFALFLAFAICCGHGRQPLGGIGRAIGLFGAVLLVAASANLLASASLTRANSDDTQGASVGFLLLSVFDTAGILSNDPQAILTLAEFDAPANEAIARELRDSYSPARLDTLTYTGVRNGLSVHRALYREHANVVQQYPIAWLKHRLNVFALAIGLKDQHFCMPSFAGVTPLTDAQAEVMPLTQPRSPWVHQINEVFFDHLWGTPIMAAAAYLVVIAGVGLITSWAWKRRTDADSALLSCISLGTAAFCSSFFVIGISCDFRYMYLAVPMSFWLVIAWLGTRPSSQALPASAGRSTTPA